MANESERLNVKTLLHDIRDEHLRLRMKIFLEEAETALSLSETLNQLAECKGKLQCVLDGFIQSERLSDHRTSHTDTAIVQTLIETFVSKRHKEISGVLK